MDRRATPFPPGFFNRVDQQLDDEFYEPLRLVTHIDDGAIAAVGDLYQRLGLTGDVLDLMSSWISHFRSPPGSLILLGMNPAELAYNEMADAAIVHDLNADPSLPFDDDEFDAVTCCVSVDYLVRPPVASDTHIGVADESAQGRSLGGAPEERRSCDRERCVGEQIGLCGWHPWGEQDAGVFIVSASQFEDRRGGSPPRGDHRAHLGRGASRRRLARDPATGEVEPPGR